MTVQPSEGKQQKADLGMPMRLLQVQHDLLLSSPANLLPEPGPLSLGAAMLATFFTRTHVSGSCSILCSFPSAARPVICSQPG